MKLNLLKRVIQNWLSHKKISCCVKPGVIVFAYWSSFSINIHPTHAQVVPDRTLPNPSQVTSIENRQLAITGGTRVEGNLFHSFRRFSVPSNGRVSFRELNPDISRVISRVTGRSPSRINGLIEVLLEDQTVSNADFYLINPNGIVFGPNASLNVGGSFLASTADSITFADGTEFRANSIQNSDLLTVNVPTGLQFGSNPQPIRNRSTADLFLSEQGIPLEGGLDVSEGNTLALVGGDLLLNRGIVIAPQGRIELGSIGASSSIQLSVQETGIQLGYQGTEVFQNIKLRGAVLNTTGNGAGAIQMRGEVIQIRERSRLLAGSTDAIDGESITIQGSRLRVDERSFLSTNMGGSGQGGNIEVIADDVLINGGSLLAANLGVDATGRGGNVLIIAHTINLEGSALNSDIENTLNSETGNNRTESSAPEFIQSSLQSVLAPGASGEGGNVFVESDRFNIRNGGNISANNFGTGDSGNIVIEADVLTLDGVALDNDGNPLLADLGTGIVTRPSTISAITRHSGRGGNIEINSDQVQVTNGATIQSSTIGSGDAGNLTIWADDSIALQGIVAGSPSGLYSFSGGIPGTRFNNIGNSNANGQGGKLTVETDELAVQNSATIAVGSLNRNTLTSSAGEIVIRASSIQLTESGNVLSATASGNGGDINIEGETFLLLLQESLVSATAGLAGTGGDGGNITIDAPFIISNLLDNTDIRANAFEGNGGTVQINADRSLIGIRPQPGLTPQSDITASSELGVDGEIVINTPDNDPSRGLTDLPENLVDVSSLIAPTCKSRPRTESEFMITGRGGVAPTPSNIENSYSFLDDLGPTILSHNLQTSAEITGSDTVLATPIIEAQGWSTDAQGNIILIVDESMTSSSSRWPNHLNCLDTNI